VRDISGISDSIMGPIYSKQSWPSGDIFIPGK